MTLSRISVETLSPDGYVATAPPAAILSAQTWSGQRTQASSKTISNRDGTLIGWRSEHDRLGIIKSGPISLGHPFTINRPRLTTLRHGPFCKSLRQDPGVAHPGETGKRYRFKLGHRALCVLARDTCLSHSDLPKARKPSRRRARMSTVRDQYEAFPYPERNPDDEKKRLITGSPSLPQEIDHFLFDGARDWRTPLRILVAGGGTGDGLIQLTALLTQFGKPYEATYIDLSKASREIAEGRAKVRGLKNIRFVTGSLLDAVDYGPFDYIDCCGVLHHLPDPDAGFAALREATDPTGGMGFMVYAPYGRAGVYPLQDAFGALFSDSAPKDKLKAAQRIFEKLPDGHPFKSNSNVNDHRNGAAGFYDLLLHSQDRAYDVETLLDTLQRTGWHFSGFTVPALYDLSRWTTPPDTMSKTEAMATAERLIGTIRTHTGYASCRDAKPVTGQNRALVPHLKNVQAAALAKAIQSGQNVTLGSDGLSGTLDLPKSSARTIAAIDGRRSLSDIAAMTGQDPIGFGATWSKIEAQLSPWGMLLYSSVLR